MDHKITARITSWRSQFLSQSLAQHKTTIIRETFAPKTRFHSIDHRHKHTHTNSPSISILNSRTKLHWLLNPFPPLPPGRAGSHNRSEVPTRALVHCGECVTEYGRAGRWTVRSVSSGNSFPSERANETTAISTRSYRTVIFGKLHKNLIQSGCPHIIIDDCDGNDDDNEWWEVGLQSASLISPEIIFY